MAGYPHRSSAVRYAAGHASAQLGPAHRAPSNVWGRAVVDPPRLEKTFASHPDKMGEGPPGHGVWLFFEMGQRQLLCTKVLAKAISLRAKVPLLPPEHLVSKVAKVAAQGESWTTEVQAEMAQLGIEGISDYIIKQGIQPPQSKEASKRLRLKYMAEAVHPILQARDDEWFEAEVSKYPIKPGLTAATMAHDMTVREIRPLVQARLQGHATAEKIH